MKKIKQKKNLQEKIILKIYKIQMIANKRRDYKRNINKRKSVQVCKKVILFATITKDKITNDH